MDLEALDHLQSRAHSIEIPQVRDGVKITIWNGVRHVVREVKNHGVEGRIRRLRRNKIRIRESWCGKEGSRHFRHW